MGYKKVAQAKNLTLYENKDVLPIGYSSSKVMSLREFDTLEYPYKMDALLNYIIINKHSLPPTFNSYKKNRRFYPSVLLIYKYFITIWKSTPHY